MPYLTQDEEEYLDYLYAIENPEISTPVLIGGAVVALLLVGGAIWYFSQGDEDEDEDEGESPQDAAEWETLEYPMPPPSSPEEEKRRKQLRSIIEPVLRGEGVTEYQFLVEEGSKDASGSIRVKVRSRDGNRFVLSANLSTGQCRIVERKGKKKKKGGKDKDKDKNRDKSKKGKGND